MPVANKKYFTKDHIESHKYFTSPRLAEQAVYCLELVAELNDAGLDYQFKGGNSLLLILDRPRRFSIDVDIATKEPRERIEEVLGNICSEYGTFIKWTKRQHKTKPWLPIASYYLFYNSHYVSEEEGYIMLDVQLSESPYKTEMKKIRCLDVFECDVSTRLPLPASIIGDKLLTLGPNTLGIPYGKGKDAQRLKHAYDVSSLLDTSPELNDIRYSFFACLEHENSIQEDEKSVEDVLKDTLQYCISSAFYSSPPDQSRSKAVQENSSGIGNFGAHLFQEKYSWQDMQYDASRVALTIAAVCRENISDRDFKNALKGGFQEHEDSGPLSCEGDALSYFKIASKWYGSDLTEG